MEIHMEFPGTIDALTPDVAPETAWEVEEDKRPIGWFASAGQAFNREFIPLNVARAIDRGSRDFEEDPNFNPWTFLAENQEAYADILPELEGDGMYRINDATSREHLDDNVRRLRYEKTMKEEAEANGVFPYLLGGFGAAILDPLSWAGIGAIEHLAKAKIASPALRGLLAGALEQGAQEFVLQRDQDLRTLGESGAAVALSAVLGAGLGAVFGKSGVGDRAGRVSPGDKRWQAAFDNEPGVVIGGSPEDMADHVRQSIGAARTPHAGAEPIKGASMTAIGDAFTPLGRAIGTIRNWVSLRPSIKSKAGADADVAFRNHWGVIQNLLETHMITEENLKSIATEASSEAKRNYYRTWLLDYRAGTTSEFNQLKKQLGQGGFLSTFRGLRASEFDQDIALYRLAKEAGAEKHWQPTAAQARLKTAQELDIYVSSVKKAETHLDGFLTKFKDREIEMGMLDPKDVKEGYYPHVYDQEAIQADPDQFKAILRQRFLKEPDPEWIKAREIELAGEDVLSGGEPPVAEGYTRFYHGGDDPHDGGGRWLSPHRDYALGYATKDGKTSGLWYVDIESNSPLLSKSFDDTGTDMIAPFTNFQAPEEIAKRLRETAYDTKPPTKTAGSKPFTPRTWAELAPEEQADALVEWEAATKQHAERYADELAEQAGEALVEGKEEMKKLRSLKGKAGRERLQAEITKARAETKDYRAKLENMRAETERKTIEMSKIQDSLSAHYAVTGPKHAEDMGKAIGEFKQAKRWIDARNEQINKLADEINRNEFNIERATRRLNSAKMFDNVVKRAARMAAQKVKTAGKNLKKAKRIEAGAARKLTLDDQVDATFNAIINRRTSPYGRLPDDVVEKSGRMKARQINWGKMVLDPEVNRFFVLNPEKSATLYTEDIGARLALRENFGEESMATTIKEAQSLYTDAISKARAEGDTALVEALQKGYRQLNDDVPTLRDNFLGRNKMGDNPNHAFMWFGKELRSINYLRAMGKVVLSSVTDPITTMLATDASFMKLVATTPKALRMMKHMPDGEMKRLLAGFEVSSAYNRQTTTWGLDEITNKSNGFGAGMTKKITGGIETGTDEMSRAMSRLNLMSPWNNLMRHIGGQLFLERAYKELPNFASLDKVSKAKWLRLGINDNHAAKITEMLGSVSDTIEGVKMPNGEKWLAADPASYRTFAMATQRLLDEALVIPGLGDLPFFMSTEVGKFLLQFQSFNFATINRYSRPLMQNLISLHQYHMLGNLTLGAIVGLVGYVARVAVNGSYDKFQKQVNDATSGKNLDLLYEAVSRAPFMGHTAPMLDFATKIASTPINEGLDRLGVPGPLRMPSSTRMAERSAWTALLGPSVGTFETATTAFQHTLKFGTGEGSMEGRRALRDIGKLMPYNNLLQLQMANTLANRHLGLPKLVPDETAASPFK